MNREDAIKSLRAKSGAINGGNYNNNHSPIQKEMSGFLIRSIFCICMMIGFVVCKIADTKETVETYSFISQKIADNTDFENISDTISRKIQEFLPQ